MHNSWGRALIAFHLSARLIFSRWRNVYNFSNARDPLRSPPRAGWGRDPFSCSFLAFCDRRSKKRVHPRFQRREGRSGEANTAGAILLCCRSGDPFLSSNSRRLFFLLSSLLGRRLTPANFQYCPKRCVSRLYFHFPRSSSPTAIIFDPISARTYTGSGIGRARLKIIRRGELYAWINRNFPETGGKFQVVKRVVRGIDRIVARISFLPTCIISVASNGGEGFVIAREKIPKFSDDRSSFTLMFCHASLLAFHPPPPTIEIGAGNVLERSLFVARMPRHRV